MGCGVIKLNVPNKVQNIQVLKKINEKGSSENSLETNNSIYELIKINEKETNDWIRMINELNDNKDLMNYAKAKNRSDFKNINELAEYFDIYPTENKIEIVWMIYIWMVLNMKYDYNYVYGIFEKNDAEDVFNTGIGVDIGFSSLFSELCNLNGIKCEIIPGFSKEVYRMFLENENPKKNYHSWNIIHIEEKMFNIDPTYGGILNKDLKDFNPFWFCTPEFIFKLNKFSTDHEINSELFNQFLEKPEIRPLFFGLGFKFKSKLEQLRTEITDNVLCLELENAKKHDITVFYIRKKNNEKITNKIEIYPEKDPTGSFYNYKISVPIEEFNVEYLIEIFSEFYQTEIIGLLVVRRKLKIESFNIKSLKLEETEREIYFGQSPIQINIRNSKYSKMSARLINEQGKIVKDCILIQKTLDNKSFSIHVNVVSSGKYNLELIYSKNSKDRDYIKTLKLINKNNNNSSGFTKFVKLYPVDSINYFVECPIMYYLTLNTNYEFKIWIDNVDDIVLANEDKIIKNFTPNLTKNLYVLNESVEVSGSVFIKAKIIEQNDYVTICSYRFSRRNS